eukprot:CAMPEP_0170514814 /NCGR_PEP_ID=MMETSP0209-20121228/1358_1 /TAXON_ID=665100 ORGANISM="Litonotus pictus, Strain P1" /NCGR_SAMPLE_ID=MMETSP0209 /ASSEMBLY_ACC=CAM_ASM_000301 /LENGTH=229 /DNA_ID=CAMNT_0010799045 /DNA_START=1 /DNA_END=690 /DNA_ORIENTATION=-
MEATAPSMSIKMPKDYDFSTRGKDWNNYKPYFLLRTDAVWEKSKIYQYFYSLYKAPLFFNNGKYHFFQDNFHYNRILHKQGEPFTYDQIGESLIKQPLAKQYSKNGEIFTWDVTNNKVAPTKTSSFLSDWGKEYTLLCMIKFAKFLQCNERSEIKLSDANYSEENAFKYGCWDEIFEMSEHCINYHYKFIFESYYFRLYNDTHHFNSTYRMKRPTFEARKPSSAKVLYY